MGEVPTCPEMLFSDVLENHSLEVALSLLSVGGEIDLDGRQTPRGARPGWILSMVTADFFLRDLWPDKNSRIVSLYSNECIEQIVTHDADCSLGVWFHSACLGS